VSWGPPRKPAATVSPSLPLRLEFISSGFGGFACGKPEGASEGEMGGCSGFSEKASKAKAHLLYILVLFSFFLEVVV